MANRYANLVGSNKIKDEWQKINTGFDLVQQDVDKLQDEVEYIDDRVDQIISDPTPGKDPELVDIRTVDPSYTPQRTINVAGDVTRDMQAQFAAHKAEVDGKVSKSGDTMTGNLAFGDGRGILLRNGDNDSYLTLGDFPESTSSNVEVRLFRNTNTSGQKRLFIMRGDGSATVEFGIIDGEIVVIKGVGTKITAGNGSPEGNVTASPGSIYLNRSGGAGVSIYVKESGSGNTGWVAK